MASDAPSSSSIYVIKVNTVSPNNIWVYDTNCGSYLESNKKVAFDAPSSSSIYVIKVNIVSPNNIWVYDTGYGSYIWIDMRPPKE